MKRGLLYLTMPLCVAFFFSLGSINWSPALAQDPLTPQQRRGKQIYLQGTSLSGKDILAYVGDSSLEVPGSSLPCANCHGLDGQGKPEAGVNPSNLTWEALTKPYGLTHPDGRKHPPYTERGLELAIGRGTDPGGNKLLNVMPRYEMSREDLADLIAYLERLGKDRDPGINEARIVIGTALPANGALKDLGEAVKALCSAFFEELNSQGGIYHRRVDLKFAETGDSPAATRANIERLLKDEQIFAMTAVFLAGAEKEILPLMAQQEVPLIGPFTLYPQAASPLNRQVFYLLSGMDTQARVMISFAGKRPEYKKAGVAVVSPRTQINADLFAAIKDQSAKEGLGEPQLWDYPGGHFDAAETVKQLKQAGREQLIFLGSSDDAQSLMGAADKLSWYPSVLLSSGVGGADLFKAPPGFDRKLFLAFPTTPADQSAETTKEFQALAAKYKLPNHHLAAQISAYCAAKILVEALTRSGKDLSREKLIQSLEGFYDFSTGLTPRITYGPNRRLGAMGAYMVSINLKEKQFSPASGWIEVK